ncbi:hypothetical protein [Rhodanobacter sp. L36]|uniref:hypothetical protein n=1 Tax=Rhodanobacter sp. L36 TaxID=1747221 RepID=UPI00131D0FF6|nr:hypothetical protein [Rhodanobacter sp. L36]
MHYDQSWMGFGIVGGMQAGAISTLAAVLLFFFFHWIGKRSGWGYGPEIGWAFLLALALTASGDLWDMFYFNYAPLQSLELLKAELALVHDPDGIGTRVSCELLGVVLGLYIGWAICSADWRTRFGRSRKD